MVILRLLSACIMETSLTLNNVPSNLLIAEDPNLYGGICPSLLNNGMSFSFLNKHQTYTGLVQYFHCVQSQKVGSPSFLS